jgi:hypothetical protein
MSRKGKQVKHWIAVGVIAVLATGLSVASGMRHVDAVRTPGLPSGWAAHNVVAGLDDIGVDRPRDGSPAELVIVKQEDAPAGRPLTVVHTIDATPWRGRTMIVSFYSRAELEPEVMRRTKGKKAVELLVECDGSRTGAKVSVDALWHTRRWIEHNVPVKVAPDATRCSLGVASLVKAEIRLSRLHLKDRAAEREALLARRWPDLPLPAQTESIFPAGTAAAVATPNLEFKQ